MSDPYVHDSHFIDGAWRRARSDELVDIVDPATEGVVARVPAATTEETDEAIQAAYRAFHEGPWPWMSPAERGAILQRFAQELLARKDELIDVTIAETGALIGLAHGLQVALPIEYAFRYADMAKNFDPVSHAAISGNPFDDSPAGRQTHVVQKAPAGVVSIITPFNYPVLLVVNKGFPALVAGCTVVLKPTPTTSWHAIVFAEAAAAAGVPDGVFNVLLGGGPDVGELMASHPAVDVVSFTGSTATGRRVMELASRTVKKPILELGGKSPNILFADADIESWWLTDPGLLRHCGQGCGQLTRLLVERPIYDEVVDRLAERMRNIVVGPPRDPKTEQGPLVSRRQYDRVMGYIESGKAEGARLVVGGGRAPGFDKGFYVEPTLFADVDNSMTIAQEEIFGPVPVVIPFDGEDEAVRIANDSPYGLNGGVWSRDLDKAWRVAGRVRAGSFGVNTMANVVKGPHGGFKQSGIGREYWKWGIEEYVEYRGFYS
jgi:aldehyde dehydrogenase (NAD+)